MAEYKLFEPLSNKAKKKIMDKKKKKPAEKKKKTLKKKAKDFANRKTKEYLDSAVTAMTKVGKSDKADLKNAALVIPKMFRGFVTSQANRLVNSKEVRKAGGLNYKVGGVVKDYSLSADDKRRRKAFKSGAGKGRNNTGMKKIKMKEGGAVHTMPDGTKMKGAKHGMKHGGMVIVDRNYLKGK